MQSSFANVTWDGGRNEKHVVVTEGLYVPAMTGTREVAAPSPADIL